MRKLVVLVAMLVGLAVPLVAYAADLSNGNGQTCADGGIWHFVNNQTGGAVAGYLTASFSGGDVGPVLADKVSAKNQQWTIEGIGTLISASTNLPGKLVLSDFTCDAKKGGGK